MPLNFSNTEELFTRGVAHHQAGHLAQAEQLYRQVLAMDPNHAAALGALGVLALQVGHLNHAYQLLRRTLAITPHAHWWCSLGDTCATMARGQEALDCYRRAIAIDPDWLPAYNNGAIVMLQIGDIASAIDYYERAISHARQRNDPDSLRLAGEALSNLSEAWMLRASHATAREFQLRAVELCPDHPGIGSNLLRIGGAFGLLNNDAVVAEHRRWWTKYTAAIRPGTPVRDPSPDRPLRIGFVSPDFRQHSVACFLLPLFENYDRERFAFFGYSSVIREDAMTQRLASSVHAWRKIVGQPDAAVAAQIDHDAIDILIDLAGHTSGNRLPLFAYHAAPVQAAWLGYPLTTGSPFIDYRITDALADPPGMTESQFTEKLWRLDRPAWCFRPPADPLPLRRTSPETDGITFGSFNTTAKLTDFTVRLWARVLREIPNSRLVLKAVAMLDESTRRLVGARFANEGVAESRLLLRPPQPDAAEHLSTYGELDAALDCFPYHGTTTTCDALWMGVPVVTLAGRSHLSRVGVSLLGAVGLESLVADTEEAFVAAAKRAAGDGVLRGAALRERMERSALRDEQGFARAFEGALRGMWHQSRTASIQAPPSTRVADSS